MSDTKSKATIIAETVVYYAKDTSRRGLNCEGDCVYRAPDGKMCAVGRCLREDAGCDDIQEGALHLAIADGVEAESLDDLLKPEYRGHPEQFWQDLQQFHDGLKNWNKAEGKGLTELGRKSLLILRDKWVHNPSYTRRSTDEHHVRGVPQDPSPHADMHHHRED